MVMIASHRVTVTEVAMEPLKLQGGDMGSLSLCYAFILLSKFDLSLKFTTHEGNCQLSHAIPTSLFFHPSLSFSFTL